MLRDYLSEYNKKRDFTITGEPKGKAEKTKQKGLAFVIQKHGARRLHYDFRLELDGVMKSWAVTRGPSFDPADKRLAVRTEDHPIAYNKFEGVIPEHQYGAGPVMIWDKGTWQPKGDAHAGLKKGHLVFTLQGERMHGEWHLVRMRGREKEKRENWLLIKAGDAEILKGKKAESFLDDENTSVISGRTLEEINGGTAKTPGISRAPQKKKTTAPSKGIISLQKEYGSVALATLVDTPPQGNDWWHEVKYDGYRALAFVQDGQVILKTRGGKDWTEKLPDIAAQLGWLKVKEAVLDGEICVLDTQGRTNFSALQEALSENRPERMVAFFFDLLRLDGEDFTEQPLQKRKEALKRLFAKKDKKAERIFYSEHFDSTPGLLEKMCQIGAEGVVSKRKDSPYTGKRTHDWLKSKCGQEQEFVIGGFMAAKNDAKAVGSLLLGYHKGGKLLYAGKVGTGFGQKMARELYRQLKPLATSASPFEAKVGRGRRGYVWTKPQMAGQVRFWEWTKDGHIRHASFQGLREDKKPAEITKEIPEHTAKKKTAGAFTVEGVTISHPQREVFPGAGITKGDMAEHYARAMPYLLPFAENRLLSLLRCPETITGECFFQRAPMKGVGDAVMARQENHKGEKHTYLFVDSAEGILRLVQMGAIEFHAWQSKVDTLGMPDQVIFDLDPAPDVPFEAVKLAAVDVRRRLKAMGLESFPRLSGGKGLHVAVPIMPQYDWTAVKTFAHDFAFKMQNDTPEAYIATMSKQKRTGRIFVDYLRNDYSSTAIVPLSLRAREGAPVAMPVSWKELEKISSPVAFNIKNAPRKMNAALKRLEDAFLSTRQKLPL